MRRVGGCLYALIKRRCSELRATFCFCNYGGASFNRGAGLFLELISMSYFDKSTAKVRALNAMRLPLVR